MSVVQMVPASTADASGLGLQQLRDTVEVQQRSIHFLLVNWDNMSSQVAELSQPVVLATNAYIPAGVWRSILPVTGTVGVMNVQGANVLLTAPGPFVSDGTASATYPGGITVVRTTLPPTPLP